MKHPKPETELVAHVDYDDRPSYHSTVYAHVTVTFRQVREDYPRTQQWSLDYLRDGYPYPVPYCADLRVSSQADNGAEYPENLRERNVYGQRVEYYSAAVKDSETAHAMLLTMQRIERGLTKERERDGEPLSYGQYVVRVLRSLGITRVARKNDLPWTDAYYRFMTLAEARSWIDHQYDRFFDAQQAKLDEQTKQTVAA
jgi:hypothetical protein